MNLIQSDISQYDNILACVNTFVKRTLLGKEKHRIYTDTVYAVMLHRRVELRTP